MTCLPRILPTLLLTTLALGVLTFAGCGGGGGKPAADAPAADKHDHDHDHADKGGKKVDDHSEWWCAEHSVPEEVCGQCSPKVAAEFQKKGDWCKMHDRPDSQCFICHPEYAAKFIAQYEAKYGHKPPKMEE